MRLNKKKEWGRETYINATDARKHLFEIIEKTSNEARPYTITINGVPQAVIMSKEDYDAWNATIETLADTELLNTIIEGDKEITEGQVTEWNDVKTELKINTESDSKKSIITNEIQDHPSKPCKKRAGKT